MPGSGWGGTGGGRRTGLVLGGSGAVCAARNSKEMLGRYLHN